MTRLRVPASLGLLLLAMVPLACDGGGEGDGGGSAATMTTAVVVADLNGDGQADIAATSVVVNGPPPHEGFVSLFLQNSVVKPGSFIRASEPAVGSDPWFIGSGDLNADGLPDLVVANQTASSIALLFQRPGSPGSFLAAQDLGTGSHPNGVAIGRVNADALPDLAVADLGVSLLLQDAGTPGTFLARTSLDLGAAASVAIGDLNADGVADLVVVGGGKVQVLLQDSAAPGTYQSPVELAAGLEPFFVAIRDLNADGAPDLVVANQASNTVSVFLQDGTTPGTFLPATHLPVDRAPVMVAIGDLNGDGRPDLAVANQGSSPDGVISVLLQEPSRPGQFLPATNYVAGFQPSSVAIGDLNADGRPDLAAAISDGVAMLLQDPNRLGTFLRPTLLKITH